MVSLAPQQFENAVPLERLTLHPENPNEGDLGAISESLEAHGFYGALIAQRSTGRILAGNHRYVEARRAGIAELPVFWLDVDDDEALRILLVDNRTARLGRDDEPALIALLTSLGDLRGTGYTGDDLDDLIQALTPPDLGELAGAGSPGGEDLWPELKFRVSPEVREEFYSKTEGAGDLTDVGRFKHLLGLE